MPASIELRYLMRCACVSYIGDCRMPAACEQFVRDHGPEIVRKNLGRNLTLHLVNLCDFGLIRPEVVYRTTVQFYRLRHQMEEIGETPSTVVGSDGADRAGSGSPEAATSRVDATASPKSFTSDVKEEM